MLEILGLEKSFGSFKAVNRVDLTIPEGEFFSLLGPSGCGKTTLLRMLGGFESPTGGEIRQGGKRIDQLPPNQRQFNMVFQRYALFPHLSVWENVAFGLKVKNVPKAEISGRVGEMLALVKLAGMEDRLVTTLSGGQQQRVALARALVNRPKVLLLDEPLSALDLKLRQQMQVELKAIQRRLGHTFIFVTHDQEEALTLSDRIAVMNEGVIEQMGTPEEIYNHPQTPFVARFIGSINEFSGTLTSLEDGRARVHTAAGEFEISAARKGSRPLPALSANQAVSVLVRPENMKIGPAQSESAPNTISGVLKEILYQGPMTQFLVESGLFPGMTIAVASPTSALHQFHQAIDVADPVTLSFDSEDSLLMKASEARSVSEAALS
jgi:spermidine/putrescine transport system ATP-binding protein